MSVLVFKRRLIMTVREAYGLAETLKLMYDLVRFVDVDTLEVCTFDKDGNM